MDENSLVAVHISALIDQLDWARAKLDNERIAEGLRQAARNGFNDLFNERRAQLDKIRNRLSQSGASQTTWSRVGQSARQCNELFKECFGFLGSALIRSELAEKEDICEIADALLAEVNRNLKSTINWRGITLLAEGNFFTETTGLIRLPFPDYGIWNLPISVHELGHFVGPRIPDGGGGFPFRALLEQRTNDNKDPDGETCRLMRDRLNQDGNHLNEYFSDLFALYAIGPVYACSAILLRFSPADATAFEDSQTHPSHAKRTHLLLEALRQISQAERGRPYDKIRLRLKELWERNLRVLDREQCISEDDSETLKHVLVLLYPILESHLSSVKYDGWSRAMDLRSRFDEQENEKLGPKVTIADVLNAVWGWRITREKENRPLVYDAHLKAYGMCREIIARTV